MALVTRKESQDRRNDALAKMEKGWGVGQTINYLVADYKKLPEDPQIWMFNGHQLS